MDNLRLEQSWNDATAEYEYTLFREETFKSAITNRKTTAPQRVAGGNRDWAVAIANHYKLELPEEQ